MSDLVEIVARGVYADAGWWRPIKANDDGRGRYRNGFRAVEWDDLDEEERAGLLRDAQSALTAIEKAGHRIVPAKVWPYPSFTLNQIDEAVLSNDDISVALTEAITAATSLARLLAAAPKVA